MHRAFSIFLLSLAASHALAGPQQISVLGLTLGGIVKPAGKSCSLDVSAHDTKSLCWIEKPALGRDGSRSGMLHVPGSDTRPKWAADATFNATIAKNGTLLSIAARTPNPDAFIEILNSVTGRFGQSDKESKPGTRIATATWDRTDIHIRLMCSRDIGCNTEFLSPAYFDAVEREALEEKRKDAARPVAP